MTDTRTPFDPVRDALSRCRTHLVAAASFSAFSNLLALVPSIYMIQVYDRVVPTGGAATLALLSLVALAGLAVLAALDWLRSRLLLRAGASLDADLSGRTLRMVMSTPRLNVVQRNEAMRDLDTLRQTVASPAMGALFDAPWAPIYVIAAFLLHPWLGVLTLFSAALLFGLAWDNERKIRVPVRAAAEAASGVYSRQNQLVAYAGEIRALGMADALTLRQLQHRAFVGELQAEASFTGGNHAGLMKFLRLTLQSAALAVGALLVVEGSMSAGAVFASSLILGRALAPIEQIVGSWKSIIQLRTAYARLRELLGQDQERSHTALPVPSGAVQVERLTMVAPGSDRVALADASFAIAPGEVIGVVGTSGAGKSTLLRALANAEPPARGHVRFDAASLADWNPDRLAEHIGYLPQSFILFPGTVKENIARFRTVIDGDTEALDAAAVTAAQAIGAHEMILRLPQGYDTPIGAGGLGLSSGQAQRIAIARALFGTPRIVVLDEPTAHLDGEATQAFLATLARLRERGTTVLFASHMGELLTAADKILVLREGRVERFVPLSEAMPQRPAPAVTRKAS
ncbi:type I secretion system permease/ATPase [Sphingomonas morindae]|uniref:Type I secretion system permease/ATPase n=1 Tax=Sphingomonas morindae TaxID=1541170 RepID=A0ABY4X768_9SPHN|nr:type I secretion system permease/ATPase [Sphingomonas morindae]USI72455.1 type I secretion system permease/ATPase [Sphingomonas morindae]